MGYRGIIGIHIADVPSVQTVFGVEKSALVYKENYMSEKLKELMRQCYLHGVSDQEEGNGYWCEQGSKERIEDLIEIGILEDFPIEYSKYETPEQYKERTGKDYSDDAPVWSLKKPHHSKDLYYWGLELYKDYKQPYLDYDESIDMYLIMKNFPVIIANEHGKPPADWRP